MNKPLTIEQLKALPIDEWVWIVTLQDEYRPNDVPYGEYHRIVGTCSHYYFEVNYGTTDYYELPYKDYGKTWIAYKNKEQAEGKNEIVSLPCKVGDTIYYITRNKVKYELDIFQGKVSMVFQKSDKSWHFRFLYRTSRYLPNAKIEWETCQQECTKTDFGAVVFTDKEQAEERLKELRGEQQ